MVEDVLVGAEEQAFSRSLSASIRVLIVEDSLVLAERLSEAMEQVPQIQILDVVDTEAEALRVIKRGRVDLVLLDLHLKQGTGFGVLRGLTPLYRRPLVIVLTNHDLPEYHAAALKLGVTEFLDKARAFNRLPEILQEMLQSFSAD